MKKHNNKSSVKAQNNEPLRFVQMRELLKNTPKVNYLWNGIKEKSFGLIFGPSKSGKSIFGETFLIALATGQKEFFGYPLSGVPQRVLFVSLEEYWQTRGERNMKQFLSLSEDEKLLMDQNFTTQPNDFHRFIKNDLQWEGLRTLIINSEASTVLIDSITRMNMGNLEEGKDVEKLTQRLRNISQDLGVTLIAIHHTPKLKSNQRLDINAIKGSSTFAQESDFAIGIRRTVKHSRYIKNVFFRYANDEDDFVKEFRITDSLTTEFLVENDEDEILNRSDFRRKDDKRGLIKDFFDKNPNITFPTQEALKIIMDLTSVKERRAKDYLSELSERKMISKPETGMYCSINYVSKTKAINENTANE